MTHDASPAQPATTALDEEIKATIGAAFEQAADAPFEEIVRQALSQLPAQFLFHMRIELAPAMDVAALVTTDGEVPDFLVVRRTDGEDVSVEQAADSDLPIAALIPSYAGLASALPRAA